MRRVLGLEELPEPTAPAAVTVGKFFAVHRGHQALLRATAEAARQRGALAVVLTFDRHPFEVLRPGTRFPILADLEERLSLIEAQGIDLAIVARVTPGFLALEPEAFVRQVLLGRLGMVEFLAGEPFRFGRGARGTMETMRRLGREHGFACTVVPPVLEAGVRISSSRIAACIERGDVAAAARLLGRPFDVPGCVVEGDALGRALGFPTANIEVAPGRLLPADGVYVGRLSWDGRARPAAVSLGIRPTLTASARILEAHLPDWEGDLYGQPVRLAFLERLRDQERFPSLEALRAQIARDVERVRRWRPSESA